MKKMKKKVLMFNVLHLNQGDIKYTASVFIKKSLTMKLKVTVLYEPGIKYMYWFH